MDRTESSEEEHPLTDGRVATKWTTSHGFFLLMGGYIVVNGDNKFCGLILPPDDLDHHQLEVVGKTRSPVPTTIISHITLEQIKDKSKSSSLTKGIAVVQTFWFIVQCIARCAQGHIVTQLEIITIAFAALNFITYGLWWNKPAEIDCAITIDIPAQVDPSTLVMKSPDAPSPWQKLIIGDPFELYRLPKPAKNAIRALSFPIWLLIELTLHVIIDSGDVDERRRCVPTFYSHTKEKLETMPRWMLYYLLLVGMVFGGIHCIAWSADFPTPVEKWIWRSTALAITVLPCFSLPVGFWNNAGTGWKHNMSITTVLIAPALYLIARITLVVQAFVLLRSLPPSAYQTVQWTTFIPHILTPNTVACP